MTEIQEPGFSGRVYRRARERGTWLCVGLDPDLDRLPAGLSPDAAGVVRFCSAIVEATAEYAAAFKINFAFFEALGPDGWRALAEVRAGIPPEAPVIADAKRGDIPSTGRAYARAILDVLGFDAVTVSPYVGWDGVEPFLAYPGKAAFVLCRTSNPGSADLQTLQVGVEPLFMRVAREALALAGPGEVGLVVGATQPDAVRAVRSLSETALLLLPGVGAQGATAADAVAAGGNGRGEGALVTVSRQILYASSGRHFAQDAARAAQEQAAQTGGTPSHADR